MRKLDDDLENEIEEIKEKNETLLKEKDNLSWAIKSEH